MRHPAAVGRVVGDVATGACCGTRSLGHVGDDLPLSEPTDELDDRGVATGLNESLGGVQGAGTVGRTGVDGGRARAAQDGVLSTVAD